MKSKQKRTKEHGITEILLTGILCAIICLIAITGVLAYLFARGAVQSEYMKYAPTAIHLTSVLVGCLCSFRKASGKYVVFAGAVTSLYVLILTGVNILFFDGEFTTIMQGAISIAAGTTLACIISVRKNKKIRVAIL